MISCVLFDFDGVIADTERSNGDYLAQALAAFGIPFTEEDRLSLIGTNGAGTLDRFLQRADPPVTREQLAQVREGLGNTYEDSPLSPQPGLREWLEELDRQGIRTGVVSSTSTKYIVTALNRMGLTGQFQVIVCGDMVRRPKPAPHSYQLAMSLLGLSPGRLPGHRGLPHRYPGRPSGGAAGGWATKAARWSRRRAAPIGRSAPFRRSRLCRPFWGRRSMRFSSAEAKIWPPS